MGTAQQVLMANSSRQNMGYRHVIDSRGGFFCNLSVDGGGEVDSKCDYLHVCVHVSVKERAYLGIVRKGIFLSASGSSGRRY